MKSGPVPVAIFVDRFIAGGTQRQMVELVARLDRRRFRVQDDVMRQPGAP